MISRCFEHTSSRHMEATFKGNIKTAGSKGSWFLYVLNILGPEIWMPYLEEDWKADSNMVVNGFNGTIQVQTG